MNILITICARKGSRGVKDKNIRELNGKPLIAYTIEVAKRWGKAKRIVCSSNSDEIIEIAKKYGAEVPFVRPEELATDTSGKIPVIRHAFTESEKIFNEKYDLIIDLDVTSPIRKVEDLDNCLEIFKTKNPEILFSVTKAARNPYFNMVELKEDGFAVLSKPTGKDILTRQSSPEVFDMNASIYFYSKEFLMDESKMHPLSSNRAAIYEMDPKFCIDIDTELDFRYIEFLIKEKVVNIWLTI